MKNLTLMLSFLITSLSFGQVIIDDFESGSIDSWIDGATDLSLEDGALRVDCDDVGGSGVYDIFFLNFSPLDMSKYSTIKLKIKVPDQVATAPRIRMELRDQNGYDANKSPFNILPTRGVGFKEYSRDFSTRFESVYPEEVSLDSSAIVRMTFYVNANNASAYTGTFYIDDIILEGAQEKLIIPFESLSRYSADTTAGWSTVSYDDNSWTEYQGPASFNNPGTPSTIDSNVVSNELFIRNSFAISDLSAFKSLLLTVSSDEGAEIIINENTRVSNAVQLGGDTLQYRIPVSSFNEGDNIITVHQTQSEDPTSLYFDFQLEGTRYDKDLIRGPYLQMANESSVRVRWRTLASMDAKLWYGLSPDNFTDSILVSEIATDHVINVTGLDANTKYYYAIGSNEGQLAGDENHYFMTHPNQGESGPYEFWVIGDAGRVSNDQRQMMTSYVDYKGDKPTGSWLLLGDNAYDHGTEEEYQRAMFEDMFEDMLINTNIYPTPGNHDLDKHGSPMGGITEAPYFDIFDVPTQGETGGIASGTESYYSWNYGNVHFISLDSYGTSMDEGDAMYKWLENDLKANTQRWTVAYCHHPPHSKGTHDSDDDQDSYGALKIIRETIMPLLESYGLDLMLTGHSHVYERSYLSHDFYESSDLLPKRNAILYPQSAGDKKVPYRKNVVHSSYGNKGTVYAVVGCSGSFSDWADWEDQEGNYMTKDFFHVSAKDYTGSFILNVTGDTLRGKFLTNEGNIIDDFYMIKDSVSEMKYVYGVGSIIRGEEPTFTWADSTTKDTIVVTWETKFLAETMFEYGLHLDSLEKIYSTELTRNHEVRIPALTEGKTYYALGYNEYKHILEPDDQRYYTTAVIGIDTEIEELSLSIYPNPFEKEVSLAFDVKQRGRLTVELLDVQGRLKTTLIKDESVSIGNFEQRFAVDQPSGMYMMKVTLGKQSFTRSVVIE